MTFTKPTPKKQDAKIDELQRLMCSVPGCPNRWTVYLDGHKPKCSKHQWEKEEPQPKWYQKDNF